MVLMINVVLSSMMTDNIHNFGKISAVVACFLSGCLSVNLTVSLKYHDVNSCCLICKHRLIRLRMTQVMYMYRTFADYCA